MSHDDDSKNKELNPKRMERDGDDLQKLFQSILDMLNPFDSDINKNQIKMKIVVAIFLLCQIASVVPQGCQFKLSK